MHFARFFFPLVAWSAQGPYGASADLTVLAIGDWGGESDDEPTTLAQRHVATALRRKLVESRANLTLLMGDNIYQHGIHGSTSDRFHSTFESVYAAGLPNQPFYVCAGNHDYGEGVLANVSSQIAYSQMSRSWRFPSLWYKVQRTFDSDGGVRTLDILVLDTVVLCGNGPTNEGFINEELRFLGDQYPPADGQSLREAVAEAQWQWLAEELAQSRADYLWVTGHYPLWSAGNDGSQQCLIDRLRPMLAQHGAHYISGHDHMMEHIEVGGLNAFVIGAGKECCYPPVNMWQIPTGAMRYMLAGVLGNESRPPTSLPVLGGFAGMRFGADAAVVSLYAHDGSVLYTAPPIPRRAAGAAATAPQEQASLGWLPLALVPLGLALFPAVCVAVAASRRSHRAEGCGLSAPLVGVI